MNVASIARRTVVLSVLLAAGAPAATAQSRVTKAPSLGADSAAVAAVVRRFRDALAAGDSTTALALLAPDVTVLESGGTETLADYRAHHLPADIEFARAVPNTPGPTRVAVQGDVAWVSSSSTTQGEFRGRAVNSAGAELMVLTRSASGGWIIRAIHWSSRTRRSGA
jgi:ketosteroid isomerase-like protein